MNARMGKAPRKVALKIAAQPNCADCGTVLKGGAAEHLVGSKMAAQAVQVQYPTANPKRCRSVWCCEACAAAR